MHYTRMHYTSLKSGQAFLKSYELQNGLVVDLGGQNVNGSLRFLRKRYDFYMC